MSNNFGSSTWAAACPQVTTLSPRVLAPLAVLGHTTLESGRVRLSGRPGGVNKQVEQHVFATYAAARVTAQVKDSDIRMPLGPPPWRPPE